MKRFLIRLPLLLLLLACGSVAQAAQGPRGEIIERPASAPPPKRIRIVSNRPRVGPPKVKPRPSEGTRQASPPATNPPEECEGEISLRCHLPGCEVSVNGRQQDSTDEYGDLILTAGRGTYTISIGKPGYESVTLKAIKLQCDESITKDVKLIGRPIKLQFRTNPPDCEIFIGDPPISVGRSDDKGLFTYTAAPPALLIEARKPGYISATQPVNITPETALKEIVLKLNPIPAQIALSVNVEAAHIRLDNQEARLGVNEPFSVNPGRHQLIVDALGYAPVTLEVTPGPGEKIRRSVTLARLPIESLIAQAEAALKERAFENVLTLSRYALEADAQHGAAHRLMGLALLARKNFASANTHLAQALAGNETITLNVRRHPREEFELSKGHDACDAVLILSKSEVEFRGRVPADNFKVAYEQVQLIGIQLKKNVAVYLGAKVSRAPGKRQDYNFYSFDNELSQAGKPYLEMLQSLLRPH